MEIHFNEILWGADGTILDVPKNRRVLEELERAPRLTPRELLKMAGRYRCSEATRSLADHLAAQAMSAIVRDPQVRAAVEKIKREPVPWSLLAIFGAISSGSSQDPIQASPAVRPTWCAVSVPDDLLGTHSCATMRHHRDNYGPWHVIGVCFSGSF